MPTTPASQRNVLHFMVKDVQYCLDIKNIERAMFLMALQTLPGGPADLAGLMNLHGVSIPIMDVTIRAGLTPDRPYDSDTPLLLCKNDGKLTGLIVTQVIGVEPVKTISPNIRSGIESTTLPVTGIINTERGLSLMLDITSLVTLDEQPFAASAT